MAEPMLLVECQTCGYMNIVNPHVDFFAPNGLTCCGSQSERHYVWRHDSELAAAGRAVTRLDRSDDLAAYADLFQQYGFVTKPAMGERFVAGVYRV